MFSTEDLRCLDPDYFVIIFADLYDVSIKSKNTGHYWYMHNPEYPEDGTTIIFHSNRGVGKESYHLHGRANNLRKAVRSIQSHDRWQLKGRPEQ